MAIWIGDEGDPDFDRIYVALTPEGWRHEWLPYEEWSHWTPPAAEDRLLIVEPWKRVELTQTPQLQQDGWRGAPALPAAALLHAVRRAQPGQRLAALVPDSSFAMSYPEPREQLLDAADLLLLAEGAGILDNATLGIHNAFRLALICVERRSDAAAAGPSRFLRIPRHADPQTVDREVRALLKQGRLITDSSSASRWIQHGRCSSRRTILCGSNDANTSGNSGRSSSSVSWQTCSSAGSGRFGRASRNPRMVCHC